MKEFKYTIKDSLGIHARPAGQLVKETAEFPCSITFEKDGKKVDAKRILGLMGLGAKCNDTITVTADGEREAEAIAAVRKFLEENL